MQERPECVVLVVLCLRQSEENDPENDLRENDRLFSDTTCDEELPHPSSRFGFMILRTFGVASMSCSSIFLPAIKLCEFVIVMKTSVPPVGLFLVFRF
jgi:hypothetical protein